MTSRTLYSKRVDSHVAATLDEQNVLPFCDRGATSPLSGAQDASATTPLAIAMPVSLATVESQALELSPEEPVELANRLLSSLAQDPEIGEAWAAEVEHRLVEVESGRMALVPLDEALSRARSSLR